MESPALSLRVYFTKSLYPYFLNYVKVEAKMIEVSSVGDSAASPPSILLFPTLCSSEESHTMGCCPSKLPKCGIKGQCLDLQSRALPGRGASDYSNWASAKTRGFHTQLDEGPETPRATREASGVPL